MDGYPVGDEDEGERHGHQRESRRVSSKTVARRSASTRRSAARVETSWNALEAAPSGVEDDIVARVLLRRTESWLRLPPSTRKANVVVEAPRCRIS